MQYKRFFVPIAAVLLAPVSFAQQPAEKTPSPAPVQNTAAPGPFLHLDSAPSNYMLGPDDQITLYVSDAEELSGKPMRIDMKGDINLPMAGRIHAGGLTAEQLETAIQDRLKKFFKDPEVVVSITEFRSQPISVLGAVNTPGVHQLQGRKTLFEVLSLAGGLRSDAGNKIKITRDIRWGRIPLPNAADDPTGNFSVASVTVKSVMNATDPTENIGIKPEDVISVPKADLVYVVGSVHKPGGFVLGENESLSALQVLSLAEGLDKTAAPDKAKIMRAQPGKSDRTELAVNLKKLMAGKGTDMPLKADDILFVPDSAAKSVTTRTTEAVIQIATGLAVYGRF
ncbi:MAG: polysaccharide biosynthesis/export family protein [Acidobacteriaceae bacterium]|nr:polysaccharide biosynthesis/export family protein [Acidobacteriaceae bacterium]MBV9779045.1 polysaccharide biosynthesis/export family protein [Acidobacteriaceae bacterium]